MGPRWTHPSATHTISLRPQAIIDPPIATKTKHREVIVVVPRSWPPQYSLNEQGKPAGFAIDVLEAVAERAGLTVKYVIRENWTEVAQALKNGDADIVPNLGISDERKKYAAYTAPVETFPISMFARVDSLEISELSELSDHKVRAVEFNVAVGLLKKRIGTNFSINKSFEEALFGVLSGTIDVVVFPRPVAELMTKAAGVKIGPTWSAHL